MGGATPWIVGGVTIITKKCSDHEIFITKINIHVIFSNFTKILNHENLELYGICRKMILIISTNITLLIKTLYITSINFSSKSYPVLFQFINWMNNLTTSPVAHYCMQIKDKPLYQLSFKMLSSMAYPSPWPSWTWKMLLALSPMSWSWICCHTANYHKKSFPTSQTFTQSWLHVWRQRSGLQTSSRSAEEFSKEILSHLSSSSLPLILSSK